MSQIKLRPQKTIQITNGAIKLCHDLGFAPILEFTLKIGRRADICAINAQGKIMIVEVKSGKEDFRTDNKWHEYLEYCDYFYFATDFDFPHEILPHKVGYIVADGFGGEIMREPEFNVLSAQRRKSITLLFARSAALKALGHYQ